MQTYCSWTQGGQQKVVWVHALRQLSPEISEGYHLVMRLLKIIADNSTVCKCINSEIQQSHACQVDDFCEEMVI